MTNNMSNRYSLRQYQYNSHELLPLNTYTSVFSYCFPDGTEHPLTFHINRCPWICASEQGIYYSFTHRLNTLNLTNFQIIEIINYLVWEFDNYLSLKPSYNQSVPTLSLPLQSSLNDGSIQIWRNGVIGSQINIHRNQFQPVRLVLYSARSVWFAWKHALEIIDPTPRFKYHEKTLIHLITYWIRYALSNDFLVAVYKLKSNSHHKIEPDLELIRVKVQDNIYTLNEWLQQFMFVFPLVKIEYVYCVLMLVPKAIQELQKMCVNQAKYEKSFEGIHNPNSEYIFLLEKTDIFKFVSIYCSMPNKFQPSI